MTTGSSQLSLDDRLRLLSGADMWRTEAISGVDIGARMLADGPHGLRVQTEEANPIDVANTRPATCFPTAVTLGSTWDEDLVAEVGRALGDEAASMGVALVLGPGLNVKRHPLAGRNFEYFSEDPLVSGKLAAAMVRGIQERGVGACVKHLVANNQESHRFVVDTIVDDRTLRELYLRGFEIAVTEGRPMAVMAAYNLLNGTHCTEHEWLLQEVLRDEWGFDGIVVSDWGAVSDRAASVKAGLDLEMPGTPGAPPELREALRDGRITAEDVRRSSGRILDFVARTRANLDGAEEPAWERHHELARRAAAAGAVLLTNDGTLPLPRGIRLAVIGAFAEEPRYQGNGSSLVSSVRSVSLLEALDAAGIDYDYAEGYDPVAAPRDETLVEAAIEIAEEADVVVLMVGLPGPWEVEGLDREHLDLPEQHTALIDAVCEANPSTVVVLSNGAPIRMPWRGAPAAILEGYLGGEGGGEALVDILFGRAEPGGRLAETFPKSLDDVPANRWFRCHPRQVEYREGLAVGYRAAPSDGVAFAFGHGLSYTTFSWTDASTSATEIDAQDELVVRVTVTNTGTRPGSDVVQVYVRDETGAVARPLRELRGFAKVRLEPSGSREIEVTLDRRAFAYWDIGLSQWRVPSGRFVIELARSSVDVAESFEVVVRGDAVAEIDPAGTPLVATDDAHFSERLGRPVPVPRAVRPFTRESTVEELETTFVGRLVGRAARSAVPLNEATRRDAGLMRALDRGIAELPLRGLVAFSQGRIGYEAIDSLIDVSNGNASSAARSAIRSFVRAVRRQIGGVP